MPSQRTKSGYIPTLDGWRAVAIGLVLLAHAPVTTGHLGAVVNRVREYGTLGVDVFFAISGLLICTRLLEEEKAHGRISLSGFYIRRTFRILPAAYLYLAVIAVLGLSRAIPMDWPAWGTALIFLRNYFTCLVRDTGANRFTGHFWSLAIEEHFYLILPFVLVFFRRTRKVVLLLLTVAALVWLCVYLITTPVAMRSIYWDRRTDLRIGSLLFPAWIALYLDNQKVKEWLRLLLTPARFILLFALAVAALLVKHFLWHHAAPPPSVPLTPPVVPTIDVYASAPRGGPAQVLNQFIVPYLFPLMVLSTMLHPRSLAGRFLEWQPLRAIGRISYSLYLWQQLFWVLAYKGWPIASVQRPWLALLLSSIAAAGSYFLVEKPLIRLGHRLAPPSKPGHQDLDASAPPVQSQTSLSSN